MNPGPPAASTATRTPGTFATEIICARLSGWCHLGQSQQSGGAGAEEAYGSDCPALSSGDGAIASEGGMTPTAGG
jgi:hypothetical protein